MNTNNQLIKNYHDACNALLQAYCEKNNYQYTPIKWTGVLFEFVAFPTYSIDISNILVDIEEEAPAGEYERHLDAYRYFKNKGIVKYENYRNWLRGERNITLELLEKINAFKAYKREIEAIIEAS